MKYIYLLLISINIAFFANSQKAKYLPEKSIVIDSTKYVADSIASKLYYYFKSSDLFLWKTDANNCEDRANAVGLLLDSWQMPNYKVWIFSGDCLNIDNGLLITSHNIRWKYHVATIIPIKKEGTITFVTIDPSTTETPFNISDWANNVTDTPFGYYFLSSGDEYIWTRKPKRNRYPSYVHRNSYNYQYTLEGLAGFNGENNNDSRTMQTEEGKTKIKLAKDKLEFLQQHKPSFLP